MKSTFIDQLIDLVIGILIPLIFFFFAYNFRTERHCYKRMVLWYYLRTQGTNTVF